MEKKRIVSSALLLFQAGCPFVHLRFHRWLYLCSCLKYGEWGGGGFSSLHLSSLCMGHLHHYKLGILYVIHWVIMLNSSNYVFKSARYYGLFILFFWHQVKYCCRICHWMILTKGFAVSNLLSGCVWEFNTNL